MGGDGHFFHDMIEGIIIWEDSDDAPKHVPITTPVEAQPDNFHHDVHEATPAIPEGALDADHVAHEAAPADHVVAHHDDTVAAADHTGHDAGADA